MGTRKAKRDQRGLRAALEAGTSDHYVDARLYDHEYKRRRHDVRYYVALAKRATRGGGAVLELGCGTGRLLAPLARAGVEVVGVDRSRTMLDACRARLAHVKGGDAVELVRGDFRRVRLRRRFALVICAFNGFMHLYEREDVEAFLATVKAHLAPGGLLAFDVLAPDLAWLARDPYKRWARTRFRHPADGAWTYYSTSHLYEGPLQICFMRIFYDRASGRPRTPPVLLTHRYFYPRELEALLHYNGFSVERHDGGFEGETLGPESDSQVLQCRVRGAHKALRRR